MRKIRKIKRKRSHILDLFLIVFLMLVSVGYAYINTNLSVGGIADVKKTSWDIRFEELRNDSSSTVTAERLVLSSPNTVDFSVQLDIPGDKYIFYVDIWNQGTIDAMLDSFNITNLTPEQAEFINYSVTYRDNSNLGRYDRLYRERYTTIKVSIEFKDDIDISSLPDSDLMLNLGFECNYVQLDKSIPGRDNFYMSYLSVFDEFEFAECSARLGVIEATEQEFEVVSDTGVNLLDVSNISYNLDYSNSNFEFNYSVSKDGKKYVFKDFYVTHKGSRILYGYSVNYNFLNDLKLKVNMSDDGGGCFTQYGTDPYIYHVVYREN